MANHPITVQVQISANKEKVWQYWTLPEHIVQWNFATDAWCCPTAYNELEPFGKFSWRMEAKDGSMGFDYSGTYTSIQPQASIHWTLDDGRKVSMTFTDLGDSTEVVETFEPDDNDVELQRQGWQAILNNFKQYVESK